MSRYIQKSFKNTPTQGQAWWHMPVIPATQEVEIKSLIVWEQPELVRLQLNKQDRCGGTCLSSQLCRRHGQKGHVPKTASSKKHETLFEK
jgi:hypothetical protein